MKREPAHAPDNAPASVPVSSSSTRRNVVLAGAAVLPLAAAGMAAAQMDAVKEKADSLMHGGKKQPPAAVKEASELGTFSKKASEAMSTKGSNAAVKEFATLEAEEQKTVGEIMMANFQMEPPTLSLQHQQKLDEMKGMRSGAKLDEMYLASQVEGHEKLRDLHRQLSESGPLSEAPVATSSLAVCAIDSHLAMLEMIQQQMG